MFNIPVTTAIWVANRDKPLNDSTGTVKISRDGNLVILDGQKQIIWSSNLSSYVANSSAMLLNTGNLVLRDNSNVIRNLEEKLWSHEKGEWLITWSSIVNECDIYGTCGPFASCNAQDEPVCSCFPGYEPKNKDEWNAGNWSSGCTRRTPLRCQKKNPVGSEDVFLKLSQVKLPDHVKWLPAQMQTAGASA
ncbi:UNVERIFIED_CONTAM: G-type lectin S-receptor-like serine/threonine-protein kinase [Sesamum angustifolium]|uniref:G-type lectin S-receptor-like serine/threonine-protein kinase n=1 Tax=Sesamum angustifolium TaxID=2727405 RepID=A0AAW2IS18_9LAMI